VTSVITEHCCSVLAYNIDATLPLFKRNLLTEFTISALANCPGISELQFFIFETTPIGLVEPINEEYPKRNQPVNQAGWRPPRMWQCKCDRFRRHGSVRLSWISFRMPQMGLPVGANERLGHAVYRHTNAMCVPLGRLGCNMNRPKKRRDDKHTQPD